MLKIYTTMHRGSNHDNLSVFRIKALHSYVEPKENQYSKLTYI